MSKAKELQTTTDLVKTILQHSPNARNSDNYLYLRVLETIGKRNNIDIESMPMPRFLLHMKEYGFPCFESVRRTRQKLQAAFPELAGDTEVEALRSVNEEVFRDYARRIERM